MPELPEVETTARSVRTFVLGRSICSVDVRRANMFFDDENLLSLVLDSPVREIERRGKYMIFHFEAPVAAIVHLKISGRLGLRKKDEASLKYERILFEMSDGNVLVFNDPRTLGRVRIVSPEELRSHKALSSLGPDALEVSTEEFFARMRKRGIAIKQLLLDQSFVAGVGNIYADEACFDAAIDPRRPANSLSKKESDLLHASMNKVLKKGIRNMGTSLSDFSDLFGKPGQNQSSLLAYGRAQEPCFRCGKPLKKTVINNRSTVFCGACQQ